MGFSAISKVLWLSDKKVERGMMNLSSESCCKQAIASLEISYKAIYLASIVKVATVDCFFDVHKIGELFKQKK